MRWMFVMLCVACAPEPEISPIAGPGFEGDALAEAREGTYVVGLTELHVKNAAGPGKRFGDLTGAVVDELFPEDGGFGDIEGWLGASFRNVGQLHWWTMTVWESREDMSAFMVRDAHLQAMLNIRDVAAAATSLHIEVTADELPLDWDEALDLLDETTPIDLGR